MERTPGHAGFDRKQRLKQGRDFNRLKRDGRRLTHGCLIANWLPASAGRPSRLGVVVSSKVGNAVKRNRARRLLREAFRLHQNEFSEAVDLVLVARPSIAGKAFAEVQADFLTTLRKARLLVFKQ
ncbi:MAG TPA: ribonuclease P protein component [Verrucomicrobiae bacterium]|nr:ribonuclease P protein component [Verrucomicrobiae bacterium]